jgi:hypothetical protein
MLQDEKISVRLKLDMEIKGVVRVPFNLTFKGLVERDFGRKIVLSAEKKNKFDRKNHFQNVGDPIVTKV